MVVTATLESCAYYCYVPAFYTAAGFAGAFLQTTTLHTYQITRSGAKFFIPMAVGGLLEAIGWACRAISHTESPDFSIIPFAIQYTCILAAPTVMAAAIYMYYEHIVKAVGGEALSPVRLSRFQKIFLFFDCFSFLILAVGSILRLTTSASNIRLGNRLVMMGLGEQMIFLAIFVFIAGKFQYNISRNPTPRICGSTEFKFAPVTIPLKKHLITLYIASALIAIRSVVRLFENLQGTRGFIREHEVFLVIFDAVLMFHVMLLLHFIHPSQIISLEALYATDGADASRSYFDGWKIWQAKRLATVNMVQV
ncbi:hypothetical protein CJF32_00007432 [Rutstroemia sp. NJR-2017a WRK4]|nr:hypothetical protein CJF32_00007432 [Rutstroemia sp. NJR-2017a WRK4]